MRLPRWWVMFAATASGVAAKRNRAQRSILCSRRAVLARNAQPHSRGAGGKLTLLLTWQVTHGPHIELSMSSTTLLVLGKGEHTTCRPQVQSTIVAVIAAEILHSPRMQTQGFGAMSRLESVVMTSTTGNWLQFLLLDVARKGRY